MAAMGMLLSVNVGAARPSEHTSAAATGIDKRPTDGPVAVRAPGRDGGGALAADAVCDIRFHGGPAKAVYAYAREDLDRWSADLGRELPCGVFGENLTTTGLDVSGALIGERWRVGGSVLLRVTEPRIPCRTFAGWMGEPGWIRSFLERAAPGAYLAVDEAGVVRAGDPVEVVGRPGHGVSVRTAFRALTTRPDLLPLLLDVDTLCAAARRRLRVADPAGAAD
jgi:MOSC domain-containing protein YiiM